MSISRIHHLRPDGLAGANEGTTLGPAGAWLHRPFDAWTAFGRHFADIAALVDRHDVPGLVAIAAAPAGLLSASWLDLSDGAPTSLVVGRHERADLRVPAHLGHVSLRHLAVVASWRDGGPRVHVLDLHTEHGFQDERGRGLAAVVSDGATFLAIPPVRLMLLPTGPGHQLGSNARRAYGSLPPRVFEGARQASRREALDWSVTRVTSMEGPIEASGRILGDDERPAATVLVAGAGMATTRPIGPAALARGVVIGRYSRCDVRTGADSPSVSRLHLLLVEHEGSYLAVDLASSNGTFDETGARVRESLLLDWASLRLAHGDTGLRVAWRRERDLR